MRSPSGRILNSSCGILHFRCYLDVFLKSLSAHWRKIFKAENPFLFFISRWGNRIAIIESIRKKLGRGLSSGVPPSCFSMAPPLMTMITRSRWKRGSHNSDLYLLSLKVFRKSSYKVRSSAKCFMCRISERPRSRKIHVTFPKHLIPGAQLQESRRCQRLTGGNVEDSPSNYIICMSSGLHFSARGIQLEEAVLEEEQLVLGDRLHTWVQSGEDRAQPASISWGEPLLAVSGRHWNWVSWISKGSERERQEPETWTLQILCCDWWEPANLNKGFRLIGVK